jgi:hypothetical protein
VRPIHVQMVEFVDKQLQQWLNVYVQQVLQAQRVVYVCLFFIGKSLLKESILDDSCANIPCKHGAGCANSLADTGTIWSAYRCICPPGFYGQNCDTRRGNNFEDVFFF